MLSPTALRELLNQHLEQSISTDFIETAGLKEAIKYSLLNGGKRVRGILLLAILDAFGKPSDQFLGVASALEYVHCYSLIHDDLPAMDDDDLRRGKPSNHKVYGEATAILAGDALLTEAFYQLSVEENLNAETRLNLVKVLSSAAGSNGMVGGQYLDIINNSNRKELELLQLIHKLKTGRLILAAFEMALEIVRPSQEVFDLWLELGKLMGEFFQIRDDIMDEVSTLEDLGKTPGGDKDKNKLTYPELLGLPATTELMKEKHQKINDVLKRIPQDTTRFSEIIDKLYDSCPE